jgi:nucleoside-diphosphate-sugar epimerase
MRLLITGCAGFIGSNLAVRAIQDGHDVTGVDNLSNGHIEFVPSGMYFIQAEFNDGADVLNRVLDDEFDAVIHLAAVPRVSYSIEHPSWTNKVNVSKTLDLMDVCRDHVKRFVFASSSSVYGGADALPTLELAPKRPRSPYALQKSIIEDYLAMYGEYYGLDSACLRFFNVFGPNQLGDSPYATAVSAWLTAIKKGVPMRSDGDGSQTRDMCYVDNVVDACLRAAQVPGLLKAECFNVACGERVSNAEILAFLLKRYPQSSFVTAPTRPGDVLHTQADVRCAERTLGYVPLVRFWEGLELTVDWYEREWGTISKMRLNT